MTATLTEFANCLNFLAHSGSGARVEPGERDWERGGAGPDDLANWYVTDGQNAREISRKFHAEIEFSSLVGPALSRKGYDRIPCLL